MFSKQQNYLMMNFSEHIPNVKRHMTGYKMSISISSKDFYHWERNQGILVSHIHTLISSWKVNSILEGGIVVKTI